MAHQRAGVAWEVKGLGGGYSGPSIAAGKVFGMGHRGGDEVVWGFRKRTASRSGPRPSGRLTSKARRRGTRDRPARRPFDGDFLYVEGLGGTVACLQVADGKIVWHKSLVADFGGMMPQWSYRESPLVDGDRLIVTPGGKQATVAALNKKTGETIWKCLVTGSPRASYVSAIVADCAGQRQYVQFTQKGLVGVAADGKILWQYDKPANRHGHHLLDARLVRLGGLRLVGLPDGRRPDQVEQGRQGRGQGR